MGSAPFLFGGASAIRPGKFANAVALLLFLTILSGPLAGIEEGHRHANVLLGVPHDPSESMLSCRTEFVQEQCDALVRSRPLAGSLPRVPATPSNAFSACRGSDSIAKPASATTAAQGSN